MSGALTDTMREALREITAAGGKVERWPGGWWTIPGAGVRSGGAPDAWSCGTTTIEALVKRGALEYTERNTRSARPFPIAARVRPDFQESK